MKTFLNLSTPHLKHSFSRKERDVMIKTKTSSAANIDEKHGERFTV